MPDLETNKFLLTLLEKTRKGRVDWRDTFPNTFECSLDAKYFFKLSRAEDKYFLSMSDADENVIFLNEAEQEILFIDPELEKRYYTLRDLYELARRKALGIDEKMVEATDMLEKI